MDAANPRRLFSKSWQLLTLAAVLLAVTLMVDSGTVALYSIRGAALVGLPPDVAEQTSLIAGKLDR